MNRVTPSSIFSTPLCAALILHYDFFLLKVLREQKADELWGFRIISLLSSSLHHDDGMITEY